MMHKHIHMLAVAMLMTVILAGAPALQAQAPDRPMMGQGPMMGGQEGMMGMMQMMQQMSEMMEHCTAMMRAMAEREGLQAPAPQRDNETADPDRQG